MTALQPCTLQVSMATLSFSEPVETALRTCWGERPGWLLAHLYDGMTWGYLEGGALRLPPGSTSLRWDTLLDLRIFMEDAELRVWRDGRGRLRATWVKEEASSGRGFAHCIDQSYLLLGHRQASSGGFDRLVGPGGHTQQVPDGTNRVKVRHYLEADPATGLLREAEHRWLNLEKRA